MNLFIFSMILMKLNSLNSISIGQISNSIYESSYFDEILFNKTCEECTCYAFQISAIGWNCLYFNQTCFLIHNYSSNDRGLKLILNSSFLFTQFPPNSSSITSTTTNHLSCQSRRWNETFTLLAGHDGQSSDANDELDKPHGIFFHSETSSLFIADKYENRIQKWFSSSTYGLTIAGQQSGTLGSALDRLYHPQNIFWINKTNSLYIADTDNHRILRLIPSNTTASATLVAGTGNSGQGLDRLSDPAGLVVDRNETFLYVADTDNHRVIRWNLNTNSTMGQVIVGVTGLGQNYNYTLNKPSYLLLNEDNSALYILDTENNRIQKHIFALNRTMTIIGNADGSEGSTSTELKKPLSMTMDSMENIYVADTENNRIQMFCAGSKNGITIVGSVNWNYPSGIFIDRMNNLYVSNTDRHTVLKFSFIP